MLMTAEVCVWSQIILKLVGVDFQNIVHPFYRTFCEFSKACIRVVKGVVMSWNKGVMIKSRDKNRNIFELNLSHN